MHSEIRLAGVCPRVLLVAADPAVRETGVASLREAGYASDGECDAEVAWEAICRHGYDLLVIDQKLPGGSGLRLVLRISHAGLTLPVVLVIDSPLPFDPRTHYRLHALTVLARPFSAERLLETVLLALQGAPATKLASRHLPQIAAGTTPARRAGTKQKVRKSASRKAPLTARSR